MACAKERAAYLLASVVDSLANSLTINPTFLKSKALISPVIRFSSVSIPKSIRGHLQAAGPDDPGAQLLLSKPIWPETSAAALQAFLQADFLIHGYLQSLSLD